MQTENQMLASLLDGLQTPIVLAPDIIQRAKTAGLVILFSNGDGVMEFEGAIQDVVEGYNGLAVFVDAAGLLPEFNALDRDDKHAYRQYFLREPGARSIQSLYDVEPGVSWTFKTDIPHSTFSILSGDVPSCRGIVFALADLLPAHRASPFDG